MPEPKQGRAPADPADATPEPIAAILAEMRNPPHKWEAFSRADLFALADRIEAAAKRVRAEYRRQLRNEILISDALATVRPQLNYVDDVIAEAAKERAHEIELAKLRAPGDAAAMRAALNSIADIAKDAFGGPEREREASQGRALSLIIDAARDALAAPPEPPSNAAAMREALRVAVFAFRRCVDEGGYCAKEFSEVAERCAAALAAPARNCDVGTAEEQAERHERFCAAHYKADAVDAQCFGCPASDKKETDCEFVWGQLPFAPAKGCAE